MKIRHVLGPGGWHSESLIDFRIRGLDSGDHSDILLEEWTNGDQTAPDSMTPIERGKHTMLTSVLFLFFSYRSLVLARRGNNLHRSIGNDMYTIIKVRI